MIKYDLDREKAVLHVHPTGPLQRNDFEELAQTVDPFIEEKGRLAGLIVESAFFPGWEDLGAVARHFRFVRDHHKKIKKVAVVTDSLLGEATEHIASHFISAKIKHFSDNQLHDAITWAST